MLDLSKIKKVYCIGIGGIGLSAIARMMIMEGKEVSGSDMSKSEVSDSLEEMGAKIFIGQGENHISEDTDLVIYTIAIPSENKDLVFARENKIQTLTYPEMLGVISANKKTIAISGTHGKTTTTAMTWNALERAGKSPSLIVGSLIKGGNNKKTNYVFGESDLFVLESCEYKRSFLNVNPFILVITNVEEDHLDYYKDIDDIKSAFRELAQKVPKDGAVICNPEDKNIKDVILELDTNIIDYTKVDDSGLSLKVPGEHNRLNAKCALGVAEFIGADKGGSVEGLNDFSGTWRRFEYKGELSNGAIVYDDYAHHPTEIIATIKGARELYGDKKIIVAFHPHLYSRTKQLFEGFVEALSMADEVILAPIFEAREKFDGSISSDMLSNAIKEKGTNSISLDSFEKIEKHILDISDKDSLIITMGAGDIYKVADRLTV